jgi:hypothetical protein
MKSNPLLFGTAIENTRAVLCHPSSPDPTHHTRAQADQQETRRRRNHGWSHDAGHAPCQSVAAGQSVVQHVLETTGRTRHAQVKVQVRVRGDRRQNGGTDDVVHGDARDVCLEHRVGAGRGSGWNQVARAQGPRQIVGAHSIALTVDPDQAGPRGGHRIRTG